jgi:hypothetical protein
MPNNPSNDYVPINYFNNPDGTYTGTMQFLHWFRFFVRNSDDYIRVNTHDSQSRFPSTNIRLFLIMRSTERTHLPCTYSVNSKRPLTYTQWRDAIDAICFHAEKEINKVLKKEVRQYLEWTCVEFVGWTTDGLIQNPEENKQAFRFTGHLT